MFVVFYTVILHVCLFVTCSTPYCLYDNLTDPCRLGWFCWLVWLAGWLVGWLV